MCVCVCVTPKTSKSCSNCEVQHSYVLRSFISETCVCVCVSVCTLGSLHHTSPLYSSVCTAAMFGCMCFCVMPNILIKLIAFAIIHHQSTALFALQQCLDVCVCVCVCVCVTLKTFKSCSNSDVQQPMLLH